MDIFAFYDIGKVTNKAEKIVVNSATRKSASASSAGVGLNFDGSKYLSGRITIGKPLTFPKQHDVRVTFNIIANMNH